MAPRALITGSKTKDPMHGSEYTLSLFLRHSWCKEVCHWVTI